MLALVLPAAAFSPPVHRALAARAATLEGLPDADADAFARGAAAEDWNLPRKWTRWHHYFSPAYTVHVGWRHGSSERVAWLDDAIEAAFDQGDDARAWLLAGELAHHLQDMASPPHVVPVAHGPFDGFETYVKVPLVATADDESVPDLGPEAAQRTLAEATTEALGEPLPCDDRELPWTDFWQPRTDAFGRYGSLGNHFGDLPGCADGTAAFAEARVADALAYTRGVIRYARTLSG